MIYVQYVKDAQTRVCVDMYKYHVGCVSVWIDVMQVYIQQLYWKHTPCKMYDINIYIYKLYQHSGTSGTNQGSLTLSIQFFSREMQWCLNDPLLSNIKQSVWITGCLKERANINHWGCFKPDINHPVVPQMWSCFYWYCSARQPETIVSGQPNLSYSSLTTNQSEKTNAFEDSPSTWEPRSKHFTKQLRANHLRRDRGPWFLQMGGLGGYDSWGCYIHEHWVISIRCCTWDMNGFEVGLEVRVTQSKGRPAVFLIVVDASTESSGHQAKVGYCTQTSLQLDNQHRKSGRTAVVKVVRWRESTFFLLWELPQSCGFYALCFSKKRLALQSVSWHQSSSQSSISILDCIWVRVPCFICFSIGEYVAL